MAELKIGGKTIQEIGDEARARRRAFTESFLPKAKATPGNIASRVDFSDEKMGPKFKADKKPVKVIKKEVSVETPSGDIGSVDRTTDVIGPDMSKVIKDVAATKPTRDLDAMQQAQNLLSRGYNMKKGGAVKTKKMASGDKTSQLAKANGIAVRGKSRGRIV
jgi:hypothetical protein